MTLDMWYCPEQAVLYHWDAKIWLAGVETQQVTTQQRQADESILLCSTVWLMLQQKNLSDCCSLLVSQTEGRVVVPPWDTVMTLGQELPTQWTNKTLLFDYGNQIMLGNFHLSCHKRFNSQNSILFQSKGKDVSGINRSSTGMKEFKCQVCICRNWFHWRLCRYYYAALFLIALFLYYLRQSAHRGHRCTLLDVEWVLLKISCLIPTTYLLLCNLVNCDTMQLEIVQESCLPTQCQNEKQLKKTKSKTDKWAWALNHVPKRLNVHSTSQGR